MGNIVVKSDLQQYIFNPDEPFARPGKFSTVFLGVNPESKMPYLIKVLNVSADNFVNEISIEHSAFINVIDQFLWRDKPVIVKPFYEGETLFNLYRKNFFTKKAGKDILSEIVNQISDGLHFLHSTGFVHRDIRPHNLLMQFKDLKNIHPVKVKILDQALSTPINFNSNSKLPYSLIYSSPEQVLQLHNLVDQTSDIYSLAISLYEIIVSEIPYKHINPELLTHLMLVQDLPKHPSINNELYNVFLKATSKAKFPRPPATMNVYDVSAMLLEAKKLRFQTVQDFFFTFLEAYKVNEKKSFFNFFKK
jgi:serine/threonine-protein kinase